MHIDITITKEVMDHLWYTVLPRFEIGALAAVGMVAGIVLLWEWYLKVRSK